MRILLCSFGSHGDIHPYLAVGSELRRRGAEVTFATSTGYRELIESHRLNFVPVRPNTRITDPVRMARIMDARHGPETVVRNLIMPALRDSYADLQEAAANADLIVSHVLTYAVPVLSEKLGKPWLSTVLSPMVFFSSHEMPVMSAAPFLARLRPLGPRVNRWLIGLMKRVSRSWSRPVAELRRDLGLPSGRDPLWEGQHSPHGVLAMFSARFGPPQTDWPPSVEITGFPFLEPPGGPVEGRLEAFLADGEPPLVVALGSSAVHAGEGLFRIARRVTRRLKHRAVFVAGASATELNRDPPAFQLAVEWAPFSALFPRAAAVIHHGGVGTTAEALRAGVPQLVIPFSHDQYDNGDRVTRLHCGRMLPRMQVSEHSLERELMALRTEPWSATHTLGEAIRGERGAEQAAIAMIRVAERTRPA